MYENKQNTYERNIKTMNENRFNEIAAAIGTDEEKIREIAAMSLEEAQAYFTANGYSFTNEELTAFAETVTALVKNQKGEMNEGELENVAGGFAFTLTGALTAAFLSLLGTNAAIFWAADAMNKNSSRRYRGH